MLPYSPLHHLVLAGVGRPLVMTSGNASDEPIAHEDDDAASRLAPLFDGMLSHDRAIHIRCDDSVVRAAGGRVRSLRRSRGFAPEPLRMPFVARRAVLAVGAELKSTISVAHHDWVVPSHHIGDLEHLATYRSFVQAISHLSALYGVTPEVVAHDLHPEYLSSKFAAELDLPAIAVQHHHAHVASCMVEHGRTEPVLGIAFDGLGYGTDGTMWGGELMIADFVSFRRVGHLRPAPMPGGVNAIREPWRMGAIWAAAATSTSTTTDAAATTTGVDRSMISRLFPGVGEPTVDAVLDLAGRATTPMTTSVGPALRRGGGAPRLPDARQLRSAGRDRARGDGPHDPAIRRAPLPGTVLRTTVEGVLQLDPAPLIAALLADLANGVAAPVVAAGFHEALGRSATEAAVELAAEHALDTVVLTGGVFQNERLSAIMEDGLERAGLRVLRHAEIPANDGGISVGQAAIAAFA